MFMGIKQSIALLALFLGVSFNAIAVDVVGYNVTSISDKSCLVRDVVSIGFHPNFDMYVGKPCYNGPTTYTITRYSLGHRTVAFYQNSKLLGSAGFTDITCQSGQIFNPDTLECEDPPPPAFCSTDEFKNMLNAEQSKCMADGGNFSSFCDDRVNPPDYWFKCDVPPPPPEGCEPGSPSWPQCLEDENKCDENHPDWNPEYGMCCNAENDYCDVPPPESCTIFSPNWPECAGDTDIDPPTGGDLGKPDKPDGGGSGNPEPDKPEPEVDDKPDANQAIKAMNEDMNKQLTSINNDINKNHAESKSALDALKASIDLNTDTSVDAANHLQDTLERQGQADAAMGNKTNQLLTSANNLLNGGFASISNGLDDLQGSNEAGFGNVVGAVEGLGDKIDGIGDISDPLGAGPVLLYDGEDLLALRADVDNLKDEYKSILNDFKNYFNFNSGVNSGDFNSHNLGLNWQGHEINKENQVLKTLRDNAGIISAVVIFMFGVAGIRVLVGAL